MTGKDQTSIFSDHIRVNAPRYYPALASNNFDVQLLSRQERPTAILYRFRVGDKTQIHSVFVKVPTRLSGTGQVNGKTYEKPLLFPRTEPRDMHWLQYTALKSIYEHFISIDKEYLGAIRVLDYLPQYHAIITEESNDLRLRELFFKENRLHYPFGRNGLNNVFHNIGMWLQVYQKMPKEQDVKVRHQNRYDYIEAITILMDFLVKTLKENSFFKEAASMLINTANEILPDRLPLGLGHGDFAMRNILVGSNSRITVLDTFAKWRTPIYEDIGYFLTGLKTSYPQIYTQGAAFNHFQLAAYENEFLQGYFGDEPIHYPAVWLYECLALLDKWSSLISLTYRKKGLIPLNGSPESIMINRYFKGLTKNLLKKIAASSTITNSMAGSKN